jgi:hypothetical protein
MYAESGYDFLFLTDHWVASQSRGDDDSSPLLWMDGIELDGHDGSGSRYHVVCLGSVTGVQREMGFVPALESVREQGALLILAHPHWMGNSLEDAVRWGFDGVEVYNHVCRWLNGKGDGGVHWNHMLRHRPATLALAVDDAHIRPEHPGWDGGWTVVNAPELSRDAILQAIRAGNYYSTCGPSLLDLAHSEGHLTVKTSPVQFMRLVGPAHLGQRVGSFDGQMLCEATFKVPQDWPYVYLELEDEQGHRAWTNALFA